MNRFLKVLIFSLIFCITLSASQPNETILIQGVLSDTSNEVLSGTYNMKFTLYDAEAEGNIIWGTETHNNVEVNNGVYNVFIGSIESLAVLDFSEQYWLEIEINNEILSPRMKLAAVPYAMNSYYFAGKDSSYFAAQSEFSSHTHDELYYTKTYIDSKLSEISTDTTDLETRIINLESGASISSLSFTLIAGDTITRTEVQSLVDAIVTDTAEWSNIANIPDSFPPSVPTDTAEWTKIANIPDIYVKNYEEDTIAGNFNVTGTIIAESFVGDGSQLTGVTASAVSATNIAGLIDLSSGVTGALSADSITEIQVKNIADSYIKNYESDTITGTLTAIAFKGDGSQLTGVTASAVSATNIAGLIDLSNGVTGTLSADSITEIQVKNIADSYVKNYESDEIDGTLTVTGSIITDSITTLQSIYASNFIGDGSQLSGVTASLVSATNIEGLIDLSDSVSGILSADSITEIQVTNIADSYIKNYESDIMNGDLTINGSLDAETVAIGDSILVVTSSGNVGISTTNPGSELEVKGVISANKFEGDTLIISNKAGIGITSPSGIFQVGSDTFIILENGNIGIGTSTPVNKLVVNGDVTILNTLRIGSDNLVVTSSGVGIGVTVPTSELDVQGTIRATEFVGSGAGIVGLGSGGGGIQNESWTTIGSDSDADGIGDIHLQTRQNTKMVITSAGNVGIGITSPSDSLTVNGSVGIRENLAVDKDVVLAAVSGNVGIGTASPSGKLEVGTGKFIVTDEGNVGIGTTSPSGKLEVGIGKLIVTDEGNIGIGTTSPSDRLTVQGSVKLNDTLAVVGSMTADSITAAQTVYASNFIGDGSQITNVQLINITGDTVTGTWVQTKLNNLSADTTVLSNRIDNLESDSVNTESRIDKLESDSINTETRLLDLESDSANTENRVTLLETFKTTIQDTYYIESEIDGFISSISSDTTILSGRIDDLESDSINTENRLINFESDSVNTEIRLSDLESDSVNTENRVTELETFKTTIQDTYYTEIEIDGFISSISSDTTVLSERIDNLESDSINTEDRLTSIESDSVNTEARLLNLESDSINTENRVTVLETFKTTIQDTYYIESEIDGFISLISSDTTVLSVRIDSLESDSVNTENRVTELETFKTTIQDTYYTEIEIDGFISSISSDTTTLSVRIDSLESDSVNTENRVTELETFKTTIHDTYYTETEVINLVNGISSDSIITSIPFTMISGDTVTKSYVDNNAIKWIEEIDSSIYYNNGNVGIGTANPQAKIHTVGDMRVQTGAFKIYSDESTNRGEISYGVGHFRVKAQSGYRLALGSNGLDEYMTISTTGNVGIGTSSPATKLEVKNISNNYGMRFDVSTQDPYIMFLTDRSGYNNLAQIKANKISDDNGDLSLLALKSTAITEMMRIKYSGRIGISDIDPDAILEVSASGGADTLFMLSSDDDYDGDRFIVLNSGNVGIGISSPDYKLDVYGDINFTGSLYQNGSIFDTGNDVWTESGNDIYRSSGNVGIGTTSPGSKLEVNGTVTAAGFSGDGSGLTGTSQWGDTTGGIYYSNRVGIGNVVPSGLLHIHKDAESSGQTIDQQMTSFNVGYVGTDCWQSFTAGASGSLTQVDWYQNGAYTRSYTMKIYTGEGTGGTLLATQAFTSTGSGWNSVSFSSPAIVTSGQQYTFGVTGTEDWGVVTHNGNLYAGGHSYFGPGYGEKFDVDACFKTYVAATQSAVDVIVSTTGELGIGNTSPSYKLDVSGDINFTGSLYHNGSSFDPGLVWSESGSDIYRSSGNVGIGTTSPGSKLEVNGTVTAASFSGDGSGLTGLSPSQWGDTTGGIYYNNRVGIGNVVPSGLLHIHKDAESSGQAIDQQMTSFNVGYVGTDCWQSFTAGASGSLTQVDWYQNGAYTRSYTMKIYTGEGTGGTLLATQAFTSTGSGWNSVSFSSPAIVTSGQQYTFGVTGAEDWGVVTHDGNLYAGGHSYFGPGYGELTGVDACFKTYVAATQSAVDVIVSTTGDVGIGNTSPGYELDVSGDINFTGTLYQNGSPFSSGSSLWTENGSDIYRSSGNIGIGTTSPNSSLHVTGDFTIDGEIKGVNETRGFKIYSSSTAYKGSYIVMRTAQDSDNDWKGNLGLHYGDYTAAAPAGSKIRFRLADNGSVTDKMVLDINGNVGIGTTSPALPLHLYKTGSGNEMLVETDIATYSGYKAKNPNREYFMGMPSGGTVDRWGVTDNTAGMERFSITSNGNVGIGTTNPGYKLDVSGDINFTGSLYQNGSPFSSGSSVWTESGSNVYRSSGNVGIGTTNPLYSLDIAGSAARMLSASDASLYLHGSSSANNAKLYLGYTGASTKWTVYGDANNMKIGYGTGAVGLAIDSAGNLGIGTTSPGQKLSVAGTVESTSGGFKFPDGSTQTSAAAPSTGIDVTVINIPYTIFGNYTLNTFGKVADCGTFSKQSSSSVVELSFNGRITVSSFTSITGAYFEMRIDDAATVTGKAIATVRSGSSSEVALYFSGVFTGLSAGSHTVSIWVRCTQSGGSANSIYLNPGNWSDNYIVVKEF